MRLIRQEQVPAIVEIVNDYKVPKLLMAQAMGVSIKTISNNVQGMISKPPEHGVTDAQVAAAYRLHVDYGVPILELAALLNVTDTPLRRRMEKMGLVVVGARGKPEERQRPLPEDVPLDRADKGRRISLQEASRLYGFSPRYLSILVRNGRMRAERIGRMWVTTPQDVEDYIVSRKRKGVFRDDIRL